jgi:crotonobetainyl-CoA:carnitine CoA-transferase CaiB-like acyl-CoA transferase
VIEVMMSQDTPQPPGSAPYDGLLVVTLEQAVAAPVCSCHFAEGGARVIKIERSEGDFARRYDTVVKGESSYFVWANHGKESLQLDIKDPEDAALLHRILARADVFIQNLAPGAAGRAGFDSEALRAQHPRLITCDISGYGEDGAYRDMKAYDFLVQCESGLVAINGSPHGYGRIGVSICDIGAGMNAIIGIQQALLARERSGRGSGIKVSLFDTAADWMTVPLMHAQYGGKAPERVGLHHPSIAPYGGYSTADGEILAISIQNEREWRRLCAEILKRPELADDPRFCEPGARVQHRRELDVHIEAVFSHSTRAELEQALRAAGIAYGAVNSVDAFSRHAQLRRRAVSLPDGQEAELVAPAIRSSEEADGVRFRPVPRVGEHSEAIRAEFPAPGEAS